MKFSVSNAGMNRYMTYADEFACIRNAGYDGVDFMLDRYKKFSVYRTESLEHVQAHFAEIKKLADDAGLKIFQTHAPFPTETSRADHEAMMTALRNSIVATAVLGAKYIVIHPIKHKRWMLPGLNKRRFNANVNFYKQLEPIAEKYGVKIALENMFGTRHFPVKKHCDTIFGTTKELIKMQDILGTDNFGICVDIGHFNLLRKDPVNAILELGSRISCLHIHDNNGKRDQHLSEKCGTLDWNAVCKALKAVGYKGVYNSEANTSVLEGGKYKIATNLMRMYKTTISLPYGETEDK